MEDPDKTPIETAIPSSAGIVAKVGTQPDPLAGVKALEKLAATALEAQWEKKSTRDLLATILFAVVGAVFPGAAQSILLVQLKPVITRAIEAGSK
jgi:hypothetical protein